MAKKEALILKNKKIKDIAKPLTIVKPAAFKNTKNALPVDARLKAQAASKIRPVPVAKPTVEKKKKAKRRKFPAIFNIGIKTQKELMIENLALMLSAGLDVLQGLEAVNAEADSWAIKKLARVLIEEIENGSNLWRALEYTKAFPAQTSSLIRVGEESGRLVENINVVIMQQRKQRDFNSKIRSAMMYPSFVLFITFSVGLGITWFILPRLTVVFSSLNVELPLITQLLIAFGKFLSDYGSVFVPSVMGGSLILNVCIVCFSADESHRSIHQSAPSRHQEAGDPNGSRPFRLRIRHADGGRHAAYLCA